MDIYRDEKKEMKEIIAKLAEKQWLEPSEMKKLLLCEDEECLKVLYETADSVRRKYYDNHIFIRGLIEFTNYCKNDCYYCGIRASHHNVNRYRLTQEQVLESCQTGYDLGIRTFVLQGGEDPYWTDDRLVPLIETMAEKYPDCAITLSIGERSRESYEKLFKAGADRYLLRHETATECHYSKLHPASMSLRERLHCLKDLKEIGFQTGCGFMVGSPFQTIDNVIADLQFIKEFKPHMVGIGPFLPAHGTPFESCEKGSLSLTLKLLSIIRLTHPQVLLPSTTALGTLSKEGRNLGILAGANVVMPNLSPQYARKNYNLYDNKVSSGCEAAENLLSLKNSFEEIGYTIVTARGDYPSQKL